MIAAASTGDVFNTTSSSSRAEGLGKAPILAAQTGESRIPWLPVPCTRVLIIDSHSAARYSLRELLSAHPKMRIVGEASSMTEARRLLTEAEYELVLLDAEIADGCGFELVSDFRKGARAIFITAHECHALRAFEVNALDYLLKPVAAARLAGALARSIPPPTAFPPAKSLDATAVVQLISGPSSRFASLAEVSVIESQQNYSRVYLTDGTRVMVRRSLKAWVEVLPANFVQVHRTTMVNLDQVTRCTRGSRCVLLALSGVQPPVTVSRVAVQRIRALLQGRFPEM
jgi:two-component system LytT family response regulator